MIFTIDDVWTDGEKDVYVCELDENRFLVSLPYFTYSDIVIAGRVDLYKVPIDSHYVSELNAEVEAMIETIQEV